MNITKLLNEVQKPLLYARGNSFMWTDKHISQQLLSIHLNPDIDLASRKLSTVQQTAEWIMRMSESNEALEILDLGCGPGLYAEIFARKGHHVMGIDISETSINYAKAEAKNKSLNITYHNVSYLDVDLGENRYDLITLIYTDFGVLFPIDRDMLLVSVYKALKKGGILIFDVLKDNELESKVSQPTWEAKNGGFWQSGPYLALSNSFLYNDEKVILYQHCIINEHSDIKFYRFWTHFFTPSRLEEILKTSNFNSIEFYDNVLPKNDLWSGENVLFCLAKK